MPAHQFPLGKAAHHGPRPTAPWCSRSRFANRPVRGRRRAHKLDDDVEASYHGKTETMIIRPHLDLHAASPTDRTIVHEATHAIQDVQLAGKWTWSLDEEATAYIAEWLYVIYSSQNPDHLRNNPDPGRADRHHRARNRALARGHDGATPDAARDAATGGRDLRQSDLCGQICCCTLGPARTASRPQTFRRGRWAGVRATPGRSSPTRLRNDQTASTLKRRC